MDNHDDARWRLDGVRVVRSSELDINTAADARHESRGGHHPRARGRGEAMGRHRRHPSQGQDRAPIIMGRWRA